MADILSDEIRDEDFELLDESEKDSEFVAVKGKTYFQDAWSRFRRNWLAMISLAFLFVMIVFAIVVPILSPYTYDGMDFAQINALPNASHWLGTDRFGRDIFVRIMYGARISLSVGFAAAALNLVIGVAYGVFCGYVGGKTDLILMRLVDIIYSVPILLYVILAMLIFGSNIFSMMIAIGISSWVGMARLVRGQILFLKEQEYAQAAFIMGASRARIMFKHLIVNCLGPIIVNTTLIVPSAIFTEAFLAFVGIGISLPQASWGTMANDARSLLQTQPLQMLWPVLAISLTMLSLNFIGDGLSEALDPKKR
ncbi:MAG: ABC transporter permease [Christensenellaceae bacterium]|nr:ABC transporter permease [Christensenellaceae bacterium]